MFLDYIEIILKFYLRRSVGMYHSHASQLGLFLIYFLFVCNCFYKFTLFLSYFWDWINIWICVCIFYYLSCLHYLHYSLSIFLFFNFLIFFFSEKLCQTESWSHLKFHLPIHYGWGNFLCSINRGGLGGAA